FTHEDNRGGWLIPTDVQTILNDHKYRPIAGWSSDGDHPTVGWSGKGCRPIISSVGDPMIRSANTSNRSPELPRKGDVGAYFVRGSEGKWHLTHSGAVLDVTSTGEDGGTIEIEMESKLGLWGGYEHPLSALPSHYGKACIIYRTDRPKGRHIQRYQLESCQEM